MLRPRMRILRQTGHQTGLLSGDVGLDGGDVVASTLTRSDLSLFGVGERQTRQQRLWSLVNGRTGHWLATSRARALG